LDCFFTLEAHFSCNLLTEIIGVVLTLIVVGFIFTEWKKQKYKPLKETIEKKFLFCVRFMLGRLCESFGSIKKNPQIVALTEVKELIADVDNHYKQKIQNCNDEEFIFMEYNIKRCRESLDKFLQRYESYLMPSLINSLTKIEEKFLTGDILISFARASGRKESEKGQLESILKEVLDEFKKINHAIEKKEIFLKDELISL
jgi:hypothetical protein